MKTTPMKDWQLIALFLSGMFFGIFVMGLIRPAHGTAVCLSHKEARQLWPKLHIFWYGSRHGASEGQKCWSNRRHGPPRGIKIEPMTDPVFPKRAIDPERRRLQLDNSMAKDESERTEPEIARVPQQGSDDLPECCWPPLNADASGNIVEPPEPFVRRWYEFPTVFVRLVNP